MDKPNWTRRKEYEAALKQLNLDFQSAFNALAESKKMAQKQRNELFSLQEAKKQKGMELLLDVKDDGTPLLKGTIQIKEAQKAEHLKPLSQGIETAEREVRGADFAVAKAMDKISLLRNLSRLLRAEVQVIFGGEENGHE